MNERTALSHCGADCRGAINVWVLVGIGLGLAAIIIYVAGLRSPPKPVSYIEWRGAVSAAPAAVTQPTSVSYTVTRRSVTVPYGAGPGFPPMIATPWDKISGVPVIFTIATGNARFAAGGTTITVPTDAQGVATTTLVPITDGTDTVTFAFQYKVSTGTFSSTILTQPDPAPLAIEVDKP